MRNLIGKTGAVKRIALRTMVAALVLVGLLSLVKLDTFEPGIAAARSEQAAKPIACQHVTAKVPEAASPPRPPRIGTPNGMTDQPSS